MARYVILLCALWAVATAHAHLRFDLSGTVLDARMPELELQFGVQNLWNQYQRDFDRGENRDAGYVYGPGRPRTFYIGCKVAY